MPSDEILLVARLLNRAGLYPDLGAQDATQLRNVAGDIVEFGPDGWAARRADPLDPAALDPARRALLPGERAGEPGDGPNLQ